MKQRLLRIAGLWIALVYVAFLSNDMGRPNHWYRVADALGVLVGVYLYERYNKSVINVNTIEIR